MATTALKASCEQKADYDQEGSLRDEEARALAVELVLKRTVEAGTGPASLSAELPLETSPPAALAFGAKLAVGGHAAEGNAHDDERREDAERDP